MFYLLNNIELSTKKTGGINVQEFRNNLILLHHCRGIGWKSIYQILQFDPQLKTIYQNTMNDWRITLPQLPSSKISLLYQDLHSLDIHRKIKQYDKNNISMITRYEEDYPVRLKHIYNPPWVLYMKGNSSLLHQTNILAVVGPRRPSEYGRKAVQIILPSLITKGYVIVSGLAEGIDALSHNTAIQHQGETIAVLGGGLFHIYPKENTSLALNMMEQQLVLSETPPFQRAEPWMFPQRNRIISGLSDGVFIVEAKERSGSLITAHQALEQGREVFALPGNITSELSKGTNTLLQEGAKLVLSHKDIEDEFPEKTYF